MADLKSITLFQNQIDESNRLVFEKNRLDTFNENWKELKGFKLCTPKNFASAGFYNFSSNKHSDNVKCFACQKELSDWEKHDDPWEEHVKRGSKCPFVLFKSKPTNTVEDFLQMHYEIKRNIVNSYFDYQKDVLKGKEKVLLKTINALRKNKK